MPKPRRRLRLATLAAAADIFAALMTKIQTTSPRSADLSKASVAMGELASAETLLKQVPSGSEGNPSIAAARAALENAIQAASVGDVAELERQVASEPTNHQARYDFAIALNAHGQRDEAADALLAIMKGDRDWNDGAARKQLLQFFEAWGNMDAATIGARRKLSALLFS